MLLLEVLRLVLDRLSVLLELSLKLLQLLQLSLEVDEGGGWSRGWPRWWRGDFERGAGVGVPLLLLVVLELLLQLLILSLALCAGWLLVHGGG